MHLNKKSIMAATLKRNLCGKCACKFKINWYRKVERAGPIMAKFGVKLPNYESRAKLNTLLRVRFLS